MRCCLFRETPLARLMLGFLCCFAAPTHSRAQATAVVEGQAHAKGVVLLRAELPSLKCPSDWSIQVAMDDGNFVDPGFGLHRGKRLLTLMEDQHGCVVNEVAFTAAGDLGPMAFVFASPGTYQLRWLIGSVESHSADFIIDQQIRVYAPRQGDLTFLRRVGNPAFLRHLFGDDFFERKGEGKRKELLSPAGADARALFVVAELLEATRARSGGGRQASQEYRERTEMGGCSASIGSGVSRIQLRSLCRLLCRVLLFRRRRRCARKDDEGAEDSGQLADPAEATGTCSRAGGSFAPIKGGGSVCPGDQPGGRLPETTGYLYASRPCRNEGRVGRDGAIAG